MNQYKNPTWWTTEDDSAWDRTKAAFQRDWDQTKHDLGGDEPNTNQKIGDTIKQAAGKESIPPRGTITFDQAEHAYRFGYRAHSHYGQKYQEWDEDLEQILRREWSNTYPNRKWDEDAEYIQYGWDYEE